MLREGRPNSVAEVERKMSQILIVTGDAGESYEALYAVHRFREENWHVTVAAPSGVPVTV